MGIEKGLKVASCRFKVGRARTSWADDCPLPATHYIPRVVASAIFIALVATLVATAAYGQEPVPRIEDAEIVFDQGLEAFEEGDYGMAYRRFRLVYRTHEVNRKTTAAMLMAGKALYRDAEYEQASDLLQELIDRYPTSSYLDDARRIRQLALEALGRAEQQPNVRDLGIVLPLQDDDATLTQALFTGIHIAVDEHNRLNPEVPIRMVFRDTDADPSKAADAISNLARQGVEAVIGPLYSPEAMAAARAAEQNRIVLIPPLANDEAVSEGRHYVFQANPTITVRGRLMAQFAMRGLLLDEFGIIAERDQDQISERMAEGFQEEIMLQGGTVHYYELLESRSDWRRLSDIMGADTLSMANAVYMPVSGGQSIERIDAALTGLDGMDLGGQIRVLGNTEWHELPNPAKASRFETTYTNDFYVEEDDESVEAFMETFEDMTGDRPDPGQTVGRLAFSGYDVARFLIAQMIRDTNVTLRERIRSAPVYQGLGIRIDFSKSNVNHAVFYFRYRDAAATLIR